LTPGTNEFQKQTHQNASKLERLPQSVLITDPSHPLFGRTFPVISNKSPRGKSQLIIQLPNGLRKSISRSVTDLDLSPRGESSNLPFLSVRTILPIARLVQKLVKEIDDGKATDIPARSHTINGSSHEQSGTIREISLATNGPSSTIATGETDCQIDPTDSERRQLPGEKPL